MASHPKAVTGPKFSKTGPSMMASAPVDWEKGSPFDLMLSIELRVDCAIVIMSAGFHHPVWVGYKYTSKVGLLICWAACFAPLVFVPLPRIRYFS
jgi:hypothetical protein